MNSFSEKNLLADLVARSVILGATKAARIVSAEIRVNEKLAGFCREPRCPNYGLGGSCPPNVEGPDAFPAWVQECADAIVVRLDIPADILYSSQRNDIMLFLHQIVSGVEHSARAMGFTKSRAFAGGSCKELFCSSYPRCRLLSSEGNCRNPDTARPSMSGFGIDVGHLMTLSGWPEKQMAPPAGEKESMSWVAGLVLVG